MAIASTLPTVSSIFVQSDPKYQRAIFLILTITIWLICSLVAFIKVKHKSLVPNSALIVLSIAVYDSMFLGLVIYSGKCNHMGHLLTIALLCTIGGVCYLIKIPELFYPGRFDFFGNGHQLMHFCTGASMFIGDSIIFRYILSENLN